MKRLFLSSLLACLVVAVSWKPLTSLAASPVPKSDVKETYTGTIVSMSGRMTTTSFTLHIKDFTTDDEFRRYLGILGEGDQFDVLKALDKVDVGTFVPAGVTGRRVGVARKTQLADGRIRIVVAFERWLRFAEVRNGYRSEDYPFGILEIILDENGKKGSGTYVAACAVELKHDKKTGQDKLELENFGTYPNKVMGVMRRD